MTLSPDIQEHQAERRNMVRRMTLDGMSALEIAAYLGCDKRTVYRDRQALKLSKPKPRHLTPDEIRRARELTEDGCPLHEVAETLNRSWSAVEKYCRGLSQLRSDPLRTCRKLMKELDLL